MSILFLLLFQMSIHSQIITVRVDEAFDYVQKAETFSFYIIYDIKYLQAKRKGDAGKVLSFDERVGKVNEYLKANNIPFIPITQESELAEYDPRDSKQMRRYDVKIMKGTEVQYSVKKFVDSQDGIIYRPYPLKGDPDPEFIKNCMQALTEKARSKAEVYAHALGKKCGEVHEFKILNHISGSKQGVKSAKSEVENATHISSFSVEISFQTVKKQ